MHVFLAWLLLVLVSFSMPVCNMSANLVLPTSSTYSILTKVHILSFCLCLSVCLALDSYRSANEGQVQYDMCNVYKVCFMYTRYFVYQLQSAVYAMLLIKRSTMILTQTCLQRYVICDTRANCLFPQVPKGGDAHVLLSIGSFLFKLKVVVKGERVPLES